MPIDIVVNGYFRSGTTFIWDYLKTNLREEHYISLYEPLHPDLANLILQEKRRKIISKLHGKVLFKDYLELPKETLDKVLRNNPNANKFGINNDLELKNYLDIIHSIPAKIFLQPNRLHFHLDIIFRNYTNKVIHIIRHPLDVWFSIINAYGKELNEESYIKLLFRKILKPIKLKDSFEIEKNFKWIIYKTGYPQNYRHSISTRFLSKYRAFDKFVVVWVISNYYAIKTVESYGGLVIPYEFILDNPKKFEETLSSFLKMEILSAIKVKKRNYFKYKPKNKTLLNATIKKYKIEAEFKFIYNFIADKYNIIY